MWPGELTHTRTLLDAVNEALGSAPISEFVFEQDAVVECEAGSQYIYVFEELEGDPDATLVAFLQFKSASNRRCPKANRKSNILYVGSSSTDLKKRISEHRGERSEHTYALQLGHWFKGKYRIHVRQYAVSKLALQIIEDSISEHLKPAFGKQGGNGR
jgi:hypothetical protein